MEEIDGGATLEQGDVCRFVSSGGRGAFGEAESRFPEGEGRLSEGGEFTNDLFGVGCELVCACALRAVFRFPFARHGMTLGSGNGFVLAVDLPGLAVNLHGAGEGISGWHLSANTRQATVSG